MYHCLLRFISTYLKLYNCVRFIPVRKKYVKPYNCEQRNNYYKIGIVNLTHIIVYKLVLNRNAWYHNKNKWLL